MSYLNLMGNKLKPKDVNEALKDINEALDNINVDDIKSDVTTLTATVNAIPVIERVTYTGSTNASGAISIPATSAPFDKTITINVVSPTGNYCDFARGTSTFGALVRDRNTQEAIASTECVFEIWKLK